MFLNQLLIVSETECQNWAYYTITDNTPDHGCFLHDFIEICAQFNHFSGDLYQSSKYYTYTYYSTSCYSGNSNYIKI